LQIISTIRDLLASGDKIRRVDGIFSVSLSYIFHRMAPPTGLAICSNFDELMTLGVYRGDLSMSPRNKMGERCSFSEALKEAVALGLMEEDPTKDLNNEYTARCLMVLAKELGLDESHDVQAIQNQSESLIADGVTNFNETLMMLDQTMKERVSEAATRGCVPRHVSSIDIKTGVISVKVIDVPYNHVFATTPPSCECVRFFTQRHQRYPLLVQGPCAGADSTASALLAELLNLMQGKVGTRSGAITKKGLLT
jgi:homoserine dehydrogenase